MLRLQQTMQLYEHMKEQMRDVTHSQYSSQMVDALFDRPIFSIADFSERAQIPKPTCHKLIRQLHQSGILQIMKKAAGRRSAIYVFPELLNTLEGRQIV